MNQHGFAHAHAQLPEQRVVRRKKGLGNRRRVFPRQRPRNRNRLALVLREYEGLSCEEIGDVMGLSRSAVKSVLFRGREEFRKLYVETQGEVA